jgi:hypothetical protein
MAPTMKKKMLTLGSWSRSNPCQKAALNVSHREQRRDRPAGLAAGLCCCRVWLADLPFEFRFARSIYVFMENVDKKQIMEALLLPLLLPCSPLV